MKKLLAVLLTIALIVCFSGCAPENYSLLYTQDGVIDGFKVAVNEKANCCFVGWYTCTEYVENQEITIPDEYENVPITRIGGYYGRGVPTAFDINIADLYMNAPEGSRYDCLFLRETVNAETLEHTIEELPFVLNIGKNINTVVYVDMDYYYPHLNEDGSVTFYHPVVYVNCSEENEYFYSENGKLYDKKTNELISEFAYTES